MAAAHRVQTEDKGYDRRRPPRKIALTSRQAAEYLVKPEREAQRLYDEEVAIPHKRTG